MYSYFLLYVYILTKYTVRKKQIRKLYIALALHGSKIHKAKDLMIDHQSGVLTPMNLHRTQRYEIVGLLMSCRLLFNLQGHWSVYLLASRLNDLLEFKTNVKSSRLYVLLLMIIKTCRRFAVLPFVLELALTCNKKLPLRSNMEPVLNTYLRVLFNAWSRSLPFSRVQ
jgi:hypothetical protein